MNRRKAIQLTALAIAGLPAVVRAKITDGNYWHFPIGEGRVVRLKETWKRCVFRPYEPLSDDARRELERVMDLKPTVTWIRTWTRLSDGKRFLREAFDDDSQRGKIGPETETILTSLLLAPKSPYPVMLVAGGFGL